MKYVLTLQSWMLSTLSLWALALLTNVNQVLYPLPQQLHRPRFPTSAYTSQIHLYLTLQLPQSTRRLMWILLRLMQLKNTPGQRQALLVVLLHPSKYQIFTLPCLPQISFLLPRKSMPLIKASPLDARQQHQRQPQPLQTSPNMPESALLTMTVRTTRTCPPLTSQLKLGKQTLQILWLMQMLNC